MKNITAPLTITNKSSLPLSSMRRDLRMLWTFLAPRRTLIRENNLDYLEGMRRPSIPICAFPKMTELKNCDAILAMGSNDLTTPRRAADLYHLVSRTKPEIKVVASGLGGHTTVTKAPFSVPEAEKYRIELMRLGVPKKSILVDPESRNSGANIQNSFRLLSETGRIPERIALIQTPAAQLRANLTFEKQWGDNGWEYYVSWPPVLPSIKELSKDKVNYYLAYALREAATTYLYSSETTFITPIDLPDHIKSLMFKYADLFGLGHSAEELSSGFRDLFLKEEAPYMEKMHGVRIR